MFALKKESHCRMFIRLIFYTEWFSRTRKYPKPRWNGEVDGPELVSCWRGRRPSWTGESRCAWRMRRDRFPPIKGTHRSSKVSRKRNNVKYFTKRYYERIKLKNTTQKHYTIKYSWGKQSVNRQNNASMDQLINQSINQSIDRSIERPYLLQSKGFYHLVFSGDEFLFRQPHAHLLDIDAQELRKHLEMLIIFLQ